MLACRGIGKEFGGVIALSAVDLMLEPGEIVGLIGPNGSGKSTLVNVISGYLVPETGTVELEGQDVTGVAPARMKRLGLSRTFQNLRLYGELTVLDNLLIGMHLLYTDRRSVSLHWLGALVGSVRSGVRDRAARAAALEALEAVDLADKHLEPASSLSYGEQKRLELARATLLDPRILVLDEPTAGLSPDEATGLMQRFADMVRGSPDHALLVVEHRLDLVLRLCTRVVVLNSGRKICDDVPDAVARNEEVVRVYVGE